MLSQYFDLLAGEVWERVFFVVTSTDIHEIINMSSKQSDLIDEIARLEKNSALLDSILQTSVQGLVPVTHVELEFPEQSLELAIDVRREGASSSVCVQCNDDGRELKSVQWQLNHGMTKFDLNEYVPPVDEIVSSNKSGEITNEEINNSCRVIEKYMNENPTKTVTFDPHGQGYGKMVAFIPKRASEKLVKLWDVSQSGTFKQIQHMSRYKTNHANEPIAAEEVCKRMSINYPVAFDSVARANGYRKKIERMSAEQTAGLAQAAGISEKTLTNVVGRHLSVHLDGPVLATQKEIKGLSREMPDQDVRRYKFQKDEKSEVETVVVRKCDVVKLIQSELARVTQEEMKTRSKRSRKRTYHNLAKPLFGYGTRRFKKGVYCLLGTDHGQGHSQYICKILHASSDERKRKGEPEYGILQCNFCTMNCKKETCELLSLTSAIVNEALSELRASRMIALEDREGHTTLVTIPKDIKDIFIQDKYLCLRGEGNSEPIRIPHHRKCPGSDLKWYVAIDNFEFLMIGDLSAQMSVMGRSGMSSSRCIKCNLTKNQWSADNAVMRLLTRLDFMSEINLEIGQTEKPMWDMGPEDCLSPILHCEIGTVVYQIEKLLDFLLYIDCRTVEEDIMRDKLIKINQQIDQSLTHISEEKIGQAAWVEEVNATLSDLRKERRSLANKLKTARKSPRADRVERIQKHGSEVRVVANKILDLEREKREKERAIDRLEDDVKLLESEKKVIHKQLTAAVNERTRVGERSLDARFIAIMKKYGIQIQAYHGGSLTGGHILLIYKHLEDIFDELKCECLKTLEQRREEDDLPIVEIPDNGNIEKVLEDHFDLLQIQDAVYSKLRLIAPTQQEVNQTKERIEMMRKLWTEMGFSLTPKAHLIFFHALFDMITFGGLGDKIEDSLERVHQEQVRFGLTTMRMGGQEKKLRRHAVMRWQNGNPEVIRWIKKVKKETSYRMTSKKTQKRDVKSVAIKRKAERDVKREGVMKKRR